jgi:hypothetical protein
LGVAFVGGVRGKIRAAKADIEILSHIGEAVADGVITGG